MASMAALRSPGEEIDLVRRHGHLFFVFRGDWIHGVVPPQDRNLGAEAMRWLRNRADAPHPVEKPTSAQALMLEVARSGRDPVLLDVGANYGQWASPAGQALRGAGLPMQTICFEPGAAAALTQSNLCMNGFSEAELLIAAVGDIDGIVPLFINAGHTEDNKIVNRGSDDRLIPTPCVRLDTVIRELGPQRDYFIKVDTQGAEWEVLCGLGDFASAGNATLVVEFSPKAISSRVKPVAFLEAVSRNFDIVALDARQNAVAPVSPTGLAEFSQSIWNASPPFCDLALIAKSGPMRDRLMQTVGRSLPDGSLTQQATVD